MHRRIGWLAVVVAVFGLGRASAQPVIPDGSFVRDSADNTWLVTGGQRAAVPIREASDEEILAVPLGDRWVVAGPDGFVALGARPEWANDPEPIKERDDPPKVSIQLSAEEVDRGATVEISVITTDDVGLEWIEWQGELEPGEGTVDDPGLTTVRRVECNAEPACSNTATVTVTGQGKFVITAQARDTTGQRSDATADLTIR